MIVVFIVVVVVVVAVVVDVVVFVVVVVAVVVVVVVVVVFHLLLPQISSEETDARNTFRIQIVSLISRQAKVKRVSGEVSW